MTTPDEFDSIRLAGASDLPVSVLMLTVRSTTVCSVYTLWQTARFTFTRRQQQAGYGVEVRTSILFCPRSVLGGDWCRGSITRSRRCGRRSAGFHFIKTDVPCFRSSSWSEPVRAVLTPGRRAVQFTLDRYFEERHDW